MYIATVTNNIWKKNSTSTIVKNSYSLMHIFYVVMCSDASSFLTLKLIILLTYLLLTEAQQNNNMELSTRQDALSFCNELATAYIYDT